MQSALNGRLRNTHLPTSKGLMPVYEAVINSIEAIEERNLTENRNLSDYNIKIEIDRLKNLDVDSTLGIKLDGEIQGFKIIDDGIGFTDKNWESFKTLDSLYKVGKGCRGIGRLMWLKAFKNVKIISTYAEDNQLKTREFYFDENNEVSDPILSDGKSCGIGTTIELIEFHKRYASHSSKSMNKIAFGLLEHCLWYFIREQGVPKIVLCDDYNKIDLFELFDQHMHSSSQTEEIFVKDNLFNITHVKMRVDRNKPHMLGYCAAGRLVKEEKISGKIPGLYGAISDKNGQFTYMAYLKGEYLDELVTVERDNFNIPDFDEGLFVDQISFEEIRNTILPCIRKYLGSSLEEIMNEGRERVENFVSTKAPKYRPILNYIPSERLSVNPRISDKDLDILLHNEMFEIEQSVINEGHDLLSTNIDYEDYSERLQIYMNKVTDLKKSDLANYVAHRHVVIDLLEFAVQRKEDGKFVREDVIHELIFPMRATSDDSRYQKQNLWLVDERLAFHHYLSSDIPIKINPTTGSESTTIPDISSIRIFENPLLVGEGEAPHASITVIEIKRPMRKGYKPGGDEQRDPILQALGYLGKLRHGAKMHNGRPIPNAAKIPGFVYVIADLTESLIDCCRVHQLQMSADGMGYFGYQRDQYYNAYVQVISYDGLIASARERNKAFFDTLGLPSN